MPFTLYKDARRQKEADMENFLIDVILRAITALM